MNAQHTRSYLTIAAAIIVAGVLISATLFLSVDASVKTTTITITETQTAPSHLYQLEFSQESNCFNDSWRVPWAVMLDNQISVQPSNATLPLSSTNTYLTSESNYSAIWFSVPNGTYSYTILPSYPLGSTQSGNVTVDGSNLKIAVFAFLESAGCSTTTTGTE